MKAALAAVFVLALITVSCGERGEPLTTEEYFVALEDGFDQAYTAMQAAGRQFQDILDDADATTEARDTAYLALHRGNRDAYEAQRRALTALTPPEGLTGEHAELLDGLTAIVAALDGTLASLAEAPTAEGINTALDEAGVSEDNDRVMAACRAFKTAAEDGGIDISLPC
ncbi:MAG: hypothetical protein ABIJ48_01445 [Actinomycetota bacterium]